MSLSWTMLVCYIFFFFKQKTAYEMRISDWSSDVCSSDLFESCRAHHSLLHFPCKSKLITVQCAGRRRGTYGEAADDPGRGSGDHRDRGGHGGGEIGRASCRERVCQYV